MKRLNIILAGVLAAQLLLAGMLFWNAERYTLAQPGQPLIVFARDQVDTIVIDTREEGSVTLRKGAEGWNLPSREGFPADASKVDGFLVALRDLRPRLPVAVTEGADQRFHVGSADFERRITLKHGEDALATLYLGDSAGPNEVFARSETGKAVYEIAFGLWQASIEPNQWMDRNVLQQKPRDIVRIDLPSFTLQRKDDKWQLAGLGNGAGTDAEEAARIIDRLAHLTFEDVQGKADQSIRAPVPELSYTLTLQDGRTVKYRFSKAAQGDDYLLRTSADDYVFKVSKAVVAEIHDLKREALVKQTKEEPADKATTGADKGHTGNAASSS
ncbi:DUF4340 domain-containing protein [Nitrococcus mobilis]|uniref:DUF4340 domain-containing protein n=1 Tax=Nitrococcus mobilis Nb-231 TaxID=314278 RepID=A4BKY6_9GAMM|nr:DUF4340 domain-containing protein [Nitrococcus mobilis]EAR22974.1 hypothetical protein NB231_14178 [Nitrococcus mobilis Nb-231]